METIAVLRQQLKDAHSWLEATMQGLTDAQVHWKPTGTANPISACYAHVFTGEDWAINMLIKGGAPLMVTTWAGKTGLSELAEDGSWHAWAQRVKVDMKAMQSYSKAVAEASDKYLATLKESDLDRVLPNAPMGPQTVYWVLSNAIIGHIHEFTGEISCLKGLQGLKGYPA